MTEVSDREMIEVVAKIFGTFERRVRHNTFIGGRKLTFDDHGDLVLVYERNVAAKWVPVGASQ